MSISKAYYRDGFTLDCILSKGDVAWEPAAAVAIVKGDALFDATDGSLTNVGTAFAATFRGIAGADCDNSAGVAGDVDVMVIKPNPNLTFWVPNESATVAAATDVGEVVDLEANHSIDVTDNTTTTYGFEIDAIDISTEAVASETGGYVHGRFIRSVA